MSMTKSEDGFQVTHKGAKDHRVAKGRVGARTEPKPSFPHDISLWKIDGGQRYSLFLSTSDAYDLADCLDELLDYIEKRDA